MEQVIILDYSNTNVYIVTLPSGIEDVPEYLTAEYGLKMDDCAYMVADEIKVNKID